MRLASALRGCSPARVVVLISSSLALSVAALASTYVNFDVPGAVNTQAQGVNNSGAVVGCGERERENHRVVSGFAKRSPWFLVVLATTLESDADTSEGCCGRGWNWSPVETSVSP